MLKLICIILCFSTVSTFAKTITTTSEKVYPSTIDQKITLFNNKETDGSHKKVSIILIDHGLSTDVSPRYSVYLGYASLAEMGNIYADFKISGQAFAFNYANRIAAGIYQIKTVEYRDEDGMVEVTQTIDATKMFLDEKKARKKCGFNFCDQDLKTTLEVSEVVKKL